MNFENGLRIYTNKKNLPC